MASKAVYNFLLTANRPYSISDITRNLQNQFAKDVIQTVLDKLIAKHKIYAKKYGNQKVYCIVQESDDSPDSVNDVEQIDKKQSELATLESECNNCYRELNKLNNQPATEKLISEIASLKEENILLAGKLAKLEAGQVLANPGELKAAKEKLSAASHKLRLLRRAARDVIDALLEGYPKSETEFFDEVGIERDTLY